MAGNPALDGRRLFGMATGRTRRAHHRARRNRGISHGDDEARAFEPRDLGRMTVVFAGKKHLDRRADTVVAQDASHGIDKHRLAVGPGAIKKHELVLVHVSGEAIAEKALQETDQRVIASADAVEESRPQRMWRAG